MFLHDVISDSNSDDSIIIILYSSGSSIGWAENWRFLGCKFKSYSGQ
jgi:hypothetical protein